MLRRFLLLSAGALVLWWGLAVPGPVYAQHGRGRSGGFHRGSGGFHRGPRGAHRGFNRRFSRRDFDGRFFRRDVDRRSFRRGFGGFDPFFDRRFFGFGGFDPFFGGFDPFFDRRFFVPGIRPF
jgi:hypothetical protein